MTGVRVARGLGGQSIARRLFLSAAFWSFAILTAAALALSAVERTLVERGFDDRLGVYLKAIVAELAQPAAGGKGDGFQLGEPRFELVNSGWYWQVTRTDAEGDARTSPSLFVARLPDLPAAAASPDDPGTRFGYVDGPDGRRLRMVERNFDLGADGKYVVQVAASDDDIVRQTTEFEYLIGATFLALGAALAISTALQVRYGLRPLRRLQQGVARIRHGDAERLSGEFPSDIAPLADELNLLMDTNREVVERSRTHVGNLAHALKTPLSVLVNEADSGSPALAAKVGEQAALMRRQVDYHLERARAVARAGAATGSVEAAPLADRLIRTFEKLSGGRAIAFSLSCQPGLRFRGESHDFEDMLGNLVDNAAKWARGAVAVAIERAPAAPGGRDYILAHVDDDGPGLPPDARRAAIERGRRLDESRPGTGLGLAIVDDLAKAYGGELSLAGAPQGGLRATLRLPGG
ncbi:MAG: sensor histidine kinase [Hyphomicrobiales bacterium]|nr:sensor histidine kinase [Hyphomicrobiales bacterium]